MGSLLLENLKDKDIQCVTRTPQGKNDVSYDDYPELIKKADIIIPTVTLNQQTTKLFEQDVFFKHLKSDVFLLNTARGELFKEEDLIAFFGNNTKAIYHTDVTVPEPYPENGELRKLSNVMITDHIAGFGEGIWEKIFEKVESTTANWI